MADASDIQGVVFKGGSAVLLARVVGADGNLLLRANLASARYTLYLLEDNDPDAGTPVNGHSNVAVPVASLVYDSLQNSALWDVDDVGYNFKHVLDVSSQPAFSKAGRSYRVVFTLTPTSGQAVLVRFRVYAI